MQFFSNSSAGDSNSSSRLKNTKSLNFAYERFFNDPFLKKAHFPHFPIFSKNNQLYTIKSLYAFYFM